MFKRLWSRLCGIFARPVRVETIEGYDPLDIAYIALGAKTALVANGEEGRDRFQGELSYIQECVYHVVLLQKLWTEFEESFPGVWAYDLAEPFGERYGKHILQGGSLADAEKIARQIIQECFEAYAPSTPLPTH